MNKLVCLVVCALVAGAIAQDAAQAGGFNFNIVPAAATICAQGCPVVCQLMRTFCPPIPGLLTACDMAKTQCDTTCNDMCTCITGCGPNCDAFEANCGNFQLAGAQGVFCPIAGLACDTACVVTCPQTTFANLLQGVFSQVTATVQQFITVLMSMGQQQQGQVAAVNAV